MGLIVTNFAYGVKGYISNPPGNMVAIFDTTTNAVTGIVTDQSPATLQDPHRIVITPDGSSAYVANLGNNRVTVIDVASDTVIQAIPIGDNLNSLDIAITPDGSKIYVTNPGRAIGQGRVTVIDNATRSVARIVADGGNSFDQPASIILTPNGNKAYVTNRGNNTVSIIDTATDRVTGVIAHASFEQPYKIAITPDGIKAYVVNINGNRITIIDTATDTVRGVVTDLVPATFNRPLDIAVAPNGTVAYVSNINNDRVAIIDTSSDRVIGTVAGTFNSPVGIAFTHNGTYAYIANIRAHSVAIVDVAAHAVTAQGTLASLIPNAFNGPVFISLVPAKRVVVGVSTGNVQITVVQEKNIFLTQTDCINTISWMAPTNVTATVYKLYRDAALTDLVGTVPATAPLLFKDHDCNPTHLYSYFLVAVDQAGNNTLLGDVTVTAFNMFT